MGMGMRNVAAREHERDTFHGIKRLLSCRYALAQQHYL